MYPDETRQANPEVGRGGKALHDEAAALGLGTPEDQNVARCRTPERGSSSLYTGLDGVDCPHAGAPIRS